MRMWVWSLVPLSGLRIWHCREPLGSSVAVAVPRPAAAADWTLSLGTPMGGRWIPKKKKKNLLRRMMSSSWQNKISTIFPPRNTDLDSHASVRRILWTSTSPVDKFVHTVGEKISESGCPEKGKWNSFSLPTSYFSQSNTVKHRDNFLACDFSFWGKWVFECLAFPAVCSAAKETHFLLHPSCQGLSYNWWVWRGWESSW